ncbi:MAG: ATP-binding protein [bacterium]
MNVSIRTKLLAVFGFLFVGLVFVGWRGIGGMQDILAALRGAESNQFKSARIIANAHIALIEWSRATVSHVHAESPEEMGEYERIISEKRRLLSEQIAHMKGLNLSREGRRMLVSTEGLLADAFPVQERVIALSKSGHQEAARKLIRRELRPIVVRIDRQMTELHVHKEQQLAAEVKSMDSRLASEVRQIVSAAAITLVLSLLLAFVLIRSIIPPLGQLVAATHRLADKDFDARDLPQAPPGTRDEVRELSGAFARMVTRIAAHVAEIRAAEQRAHRLNIELDRHIAELKTANAELEAFSYSVSHDLRAPLRSMDGFSKVLLERYAGGLDGKGRHYLDRIRAGAVTMGRLIDGILELSRVSRAALKREVIDLAELARNLAASLREDEPGREVELVIPERLAASGDRRLLGSVLQNLLGNAWKFTAKEAVARIELGLTEQQEYFVRDNGVGFDEAYADKLFGAFQRLPPASEFDGLGIGLATVRWIIRRHGGRVRAESGLGRGATFFFTLG